MEHESKLKLPKIEAGSGHTIFEYVPNDSGDNVGFIALFGRRSRYRTLFPN